ncbi:MAG: AAA family ATPase [Acidimicrobiia bacterium]|nr:AAA family ATPase [Acidimicrobiia bacterium]
MTFESSAEIGVVVGKFYPPHLGHVHLLETALAQVERLYVLVGDRLDPTIPASTRAEWLADAVPAATIIVTPDYLPEANQPLADRALELLPERPTIAFTSEQWGQGWAEAMGARHVMVDLDRTRFPISSSEIRSNLREHYTWLVPAARAALAKRVVLAGAESTGKSTLAVDLANHYQTVWVPEYGRWYSDGRAGLKDRTWTADEFVRIAITHHQGEADLARRSANGLVILDTDALVTKVWHRRYLDSPNPILEELVDEFLPDLYFVCAPDFEWVHDGTRESPNYRDSMHIDTLQLIAATGVPFIELTGDQSKRLKEAIAVIDETVHSEPLI